jgi:hypothetical protein
MIPKELSHSTPEISRSIDPKPRQTDLKSREICSISSIIALLSASSIIALLSALWFLRFG